MNNPFKQDSAIAKAFDLAVKGTTREAITKLCEKAEIGSARVFWCLRRNAYGEVKWQFRQDENGNIKLMPSTSKVAAKKTAAAPAAKPVTKKVVAKATKTQPKAKATPKVVEAPKQKEAAPVAA